MNYSEKNIRKMWKRIIIQGFAIAGVVIAFAVMFSMWGLKLNPVAQISFLAIAVLMTVLLVLFYMFSTAYDRLKSEIKKNENDYIFHKQGPKRWAAKFQDEVCFLDDLRGVRYIAQLLAQVNKQIPAIELYQSINGSSNKNKKGSKDSYEVMDREYLKECRDTINELEGELERARKNNDIAEENRIQTEINGVRKILVTSKGLKGQIRAFADEQEKARISVTQAIKRVLRSIEKKYPKLYRHLKNSIHTGGNCSYTPDSKIPWYL